MRIALNPPMPDSLFPQSDHATASVTGNSVSAMDASPGIILVDDDPAVLGSLKLVLEAEGFEVAGFGDPISALMWASDADPSCIVVDLKLPGIEGLDLVAGFCALQRHCVILISGYVDVVTAVDAMRLGVDDVIPKPANADRLVASARKGLKALSQLPVTDVLTFTRRERQVAELMVGGRTTKQIAQALNISPRTVEFFRASLLRKTQSPNTAALASALTRIGFLPRLD